MIAAHKCVDTVGFSCGVRATASASCLRITRRPAGSAAMTMRAPPCWPASQIVMVAGGSDVDGPLAEIPTRRPRPVRLLQDSASIAAPQALQKYSRHSPSPHSHPYVHTVTRGAFLDVGSGHLCERSLRRWTSHRCLPLYG